MKKSISFTKSDLITLIIVAACVIADRASKIAATAFLAPNGDKTVIKNVINLTYTLNEGAAFGILENRRWIFIAVTVVMIVLLSFALIKRMVKGKLGIVAAALIIGGGIGNLIDRVFSGTVVDFINFKLIYFICPAIFNVADVCIVAGAFIGAFWILFMGGDIGNGKSKSDGDGKDTDKT